jgi:hypothetical protein
MTTARTRDFDPLSILAALERGYVDYVLIGGLAQVLRGVDVVTDGVDICPSFSRGNLDRLGSALGEPVVVDGASPVTEEALAAEPVVRLQTNAGTLQVVGSPAGVPNGFVELRRAASREDLGGGLRPLVASSGDLAAMAAALHRPADVERLAMLRRVVELETDRAVAPPPGRAARGTGRARSAARQITP